MIASSESVIDRNGGLPLFFRARDIVTVSFFQPEKAAPAVEPPNLAHSQFGCGFWHQAQ